MQRGDVEALDAQRRRVERERALELQKRLVGAVVGIARAHHVAVERVVGVGRRHLQQMALLAALRDVHATDAATARGQPLGDELGVGELQRHADLCGHVGRLAVVALDEALDELLLAHVGALVEHELAGTDHATLADHKHAGGGYGLLAVEAHRVEAHVGGEHHLLVVVEALEHVDAMLDAPGALELELGRGLGHLLAQVADDGRAAALQKLLHLPDMAAVVGRGDGTAAHARPAPHVGVEAGAPALGEHEVGHRHVIGMAVQVALGALPLRAGADADGHHLAQRVDGLARGAGVGVGAKVARALAVLLARVLDGRIRVDSVIAMKG